MAKRRRRKTGTAKKIVRALNREFNPVRIIKSTIRKRRSRIW